MNTIARVVISAAVLTLLSPAVSSSQDTRPRIVRSSISAPVEIDGVPCAAGYLFREALTGRLHQCRLDDDAVVRNAFLRKGTTVALNPNGSIRYVFLPGTTMVGTHSCRGQGHGWMTHFHPNGELRLCWLSHDEVIQGVPCSRATFWGECFGGKYATTEFHDNGMLASCVVSETADIGARHYEAGERVKLDRDGRAVALKVPSGGVPRVR
jgi:hypothetical protein